MPYYAQESTGHCLWHLHRELTQNRCDHGIVEAKPWMKIDQSQQRCHFSFCPWDRNGKNLANYWSRLFQYSISYNKSQKLYLCILVGLTISPNCQSLTSIVWSPSTSSSRVLLKIECHQDKRQCLFSILSIP